MRIAVIGTGMVGQALAGRFDELGHEVVVGTRDPAEALARIGTTPTGGVGFGSWAGEHQDIEVLALAAAAEGADVVVNATTGAVSLEAFEQLDPAALDGVVVLDVANPLDFSGGFPPTLTVKDTDSLGEQLQRAFPQARVVKALNTMNASVMVHPELVAGGDHTTFVSGDDNDAKEVVLGLLEQLGHIDVIDLGGIESARGTEMLMPIWVRLMAALGTPVFQFKVQR